MILKPEVTAYIEKTPSEQKEILIALRQLIQEAVPSGKEEFKWSRPVYATTKGLCYLFATKRYVTFGFYDFEKIEDPDQLLEGEGKMMRHIKIRTASEINKDLLKKWLQAVAA